MPSLADIRLPTRQELDRYLKDPEILTSEILFLGLTLSNIFIVYRLFLDVIPYPMFVTWWQLAQGLFMAYCLGETGREFPKFAYFPKVEIRRDLLKQLAIPTALNAAMLVLGNVLLYKTPCVATLPVAVSLAVVCHHLTRFIGCGEEYMPMRWQSIGCLFLAFVIGCTDPFTVNHSMLFYAVLYALFAAAFRAAFLQKVMHEVQGRGNVLHNHQHILSIGFVFVAMLVFGEAHKVLYHMPMNFNSLITWQTWGCLIAVGSIPFLKNIVSNRLIRRTGQGPWRALEVLSIFLVFTIGCAIGGSPGWQGYVATILVVFGRFLGACDVMLNASYAESSNEHLTNSQQRGSSSDGIHNNDNMDTLEGGKGSAYQLQAIDEDGNEAYGADAEHQATHL